MENEGKDARFCGLVIIAVIILPVVLLGFATYPEIHKSQMDEEAAVYEQNYKVKNGPLIDAVASGQRKQASIVLETNRAKSYNENLNDKISELNQMGIKVTQVSLGANNEATLLMIEKNSDE